MRHQRTRAKAIKEPTPTEPADAFNNRKNFLWVILAAGMAVTVVGSQFLPGVGMHDSLTSIYSSMLWCGIFGAALARYMSKNGWIGFAVGSVLGVTLNILASVI